MTIVEQMRQRRDARRAEYQSSDRKIRSLQSKNGHLKRKLAEKDAQIDELIEQVKFYRERAQRG